jgi:hypothetical protein
MNDEQRDTADNKMTAAEWFAVRRAAAAYIDVETAEVDWSYRGISDPYGLVPFHKDKRTYNRIVGPDGKIFFVCPEAGSSEKEIASSKFSKEEGGSTYCVIPEAEFTLPEGAQVITRTFFAKAPGSDVWVWFGDLPEATAAALWKKHERTLAAFPSVAAQTQAMPSFVFGRRRDIEIEAGFTLAGDLIIDVPKQTKIKKRHKRMFESIVKDLIKMAVAGQMPDDAMVYGWPDGERPANADAITDNDEIMAEWARTRHHVVVRVDPRKDDGSLHLDSDIAKRLGLISVH